MMTSKGTHIDIRLGQAAGREQAAFADGNAGTAGVRNKWVAVRMALIFVGMLAVTMYATGVYQQGVRPHVAPVLARVNARVRGESAATSIALAVANTAAASVVVVAESE